MSGSSAIYLTVAGGSIDSQFTSRGADTGLSSSQVVISNGATKVISTRDPWK